MKKAALIIPVVTLALLALAVPALAEGPEATPEWRLIWNQVWKIINFVILAFLAVKLGKEPIKAFIAGQRDTLAGELKEMEEAKAKAAKELEETEARIANLAAELDDFRQMVTDQAKKELDHMMEQARFETETILDRTKRQSEMALLKARKRMASELVGLAGKEAEKILAANIGKKDQERFISDFAEQVEAQAKV